MTETVVEKIEEKVKHVPKKVWIIGGIVLVLLLLFLRKRAQRASESGEDPGLAAAMTLPTGLQYAPISSGVGGGTGSGNSDIGGQLSNIPGVANLTGGTAATTPATTGAAATTTVLNSSPIVGTNSTAPAAPSNTGNSNFFANERTGILQYGDVNRELSLSQVLDFFRANPITNKTQLAQLYNWGHSIGLSNLGISQARAIAKNQLGVDTYSIAQDMGDPNGTAWDALVASSGPGNFVIPGASSPTSGVESRSSAPAMSSPSVAATPVAPVATPAAVAPSGAVNGSKWDYLGRYVGGFNDGDSSGAMGGNGSAGEGAGGADGMGW